MIQHNGTATWRQADPEVRAVGEQLYWLMESRDDEQAWATTCFSSATPFAFVKLLAARPGRMPRRHPTHSERGRPISGAVRKLANDRTAQALTQAAWNAVNRQFGFQLCLSEKVHLYNMWAPPLIMWWLEDRDNPVLGLDPKVLLKLFEEEAVCILGTRSVPRGKRPPSEFLADALERYVGAGR